SLPSRLRAGNVFPGYRAVPSQRLTGDGSPYPEKGRVDERLPTEKHGNHRRAFSRNRIFSVSFREFRGQPLGSLARIQSKPWVKPMIRSSLDPRLPGRAGTPAVPVLPPASRYASRIGAWQTLIDSV